MTQQKPRKEPTEPACLDIARIEQSIYLIRGSRVMLDSDLAALYEVETKQLKRQVSRNRARFPEDFMFQLAADEWLRLRCQIGTSKGRGGARYAPYVFTEQGVAMLTHRDLAQKLQQLEAKYDRQFAVVFDAIRKLLEPPPRKRQRRIGFQ